MATNSLTNKQVQLGLKENKLTQSVKTRWNSTYFMIKRLLEQRESITSVLSDNASNFMLNKQEWATIENLVQILEPFELITNVLSTEVQSSISMVMTILQSLLQNFICKELEEESELITKMKFILQHQLKSRFSTILDDKCHTGETRIDILDISTFLDPLFKKQRKICWLNYKN